jgi:uncharacterized protein (DUF1697 family)
MVYLALLRAINLGGRSLVSMTDLRQLLADLGFSDARTLLQSGNAVFRSAARSGDQLERRLEKEAPGRLNVRTDFFVRSADEWQQIIADNPFPREAERDPGHLVVALLKKAPADADVKALRAAITGREVVGRGARHVYIVYPDGIGRSRLTSALAEKKLGTRGTARNWNTVLKLAALAELLGTTQATKTTQIPKITKNSKKTTVEK